MAEVTRTTARGMAFARAADALLRALGGIEITLRLAQTNAAADRQRELGLSAPPVQDVRVSPVAVRSLPPEKGRLRLELMMSASALASAMEMRDSSEAGTELLEQALGVVWEGTLLRVISVESRSFAGMPCMYRVVVGS